MLRHVESLIAGTSAVDRRVLAGYEERVWLVVVELGGFKNL
jgi:hypothetical protein